MKRKFMPVIGALLAAICVASFTGCGAVSFDFGYFAVAGQKLTSLATEGINFVSAKVITDNYKWKGGAQATGFNIDPASSFGTEAGESFLLEEQDITNIQMEFKGIKISTYFWTIIEKSGKLEKVENSWTIMTSDFKKALDDNMVTVGPTIRVPNLICRTQMLDWCEDKNNIFKAEDRYKEAPFKNLYTYHKTSDKTDEYLVLGTHAFTEISSMSYFGGATCQYIQENETKFDSEGKILKFQSSLGIVLNSDGTQYIGTNFEVEFEWLIKE